MTMAVPPSSMAQPMSMSRPVAQLVTTMTGSPLVTSISMAPTQPAGTLVTSMSLAPSMQSAQPIMTSINGRGHGIWTDAATPQPDIANLVRTSDRVVNVKYPRSGLSVYASSADYDSSTKYCSGLPIILIANRVRGRAHKASECFIQNFNLLCVFSFCPCSTKYK